MGDNAVIQLKKQISEIEISMSLAAGNRLDGVKSTRAQVGYIKERNRRIWQISSLEEEIKIKRQNSIQLQKQIDKYGASN